MKLPVYPKYKPSGVEWFGDVPEHWEAAQLRRKAHILDCKHRTVPFIDDGIPVASIREVHGMEVDLTDAKMTSEEEYLTLIEGDRRPRLGDIIYSRNATVGDAALVTRTERFCMGQDVCLIRSLKHHPRFLLYLLHSSALSEQVESLMIGSTFRRINVGQIHGFWICVPPLSEQAAIAAYLDRETGRVDRLVAKKRELIERLKEKRTALISRTVTRGLPPAAARAAGLPDMSAEASAKAENPLLKPSALDWLGDIPAHWDTVPVRYAFYNLDHRRIPVAGEDRANVEKIYPYYGASGIIDHVEDYLFEETLILVAEDGANLLSRSTPLAFLATGKYWVNNHAHILKPVEGDIRYWAAVLQTYDYTPLVTGAAQPKLTSERLGSIRLPKPPPEEQAAIAAYLDVETAKLDALVGKVEEAVERLQEYRTALITAAVTGKIDVRKCSHPLR